MPSVSGRLENNRIRIKIGIRPFWPGVPLGASPDTVDLTFRQYVALVDTGAQRTCVSERVVQECGLRRRGRVEIASVKSTELHFTYLFYVGFWPDAVNDIPAAVFGIGDAIEGIDAGDSRYFDVLLGMDILSQGSLHLERDGRFVIAF